MFREEVEALRGATERARVKAVVVGIGGCGCNTVNNLKSYGVPVPTIAVNTDAAVLQRTKADKRILLGEALTKGRGAAGIPSIGKKCAEMDAHKVVDAVRDYEYVMLTAGMGGGTGTGALPVIASRIKDELKNVLVVSIVTLPFSAEGIQRIKNAQMGLAETMDASDMIIVNSNDLLLEKLGGRRVPISRAFKVMDKHLVDIISAIIDLQSLEPKPGLINIDFSNIEYLTRESGLGMVGIGSGRTVSMALEEAIRNNYCNADITNCKGTAVCVEGYEAMIDIHELEEIPRILSSRYNVSTVFWGVKSNWRLHTPKVMVYATGVRSEYVEKYLKGV